MGEPCFPPGFEDLESLAGWALPTEVERSRRRLGSPYDELLALYDHLLPRLDEILTHLDGYAIGEMPPEAERLMNLALALAEVAPTVEYYHQPTVINGFDPDRITIHQ